jgi:hypothetical protein
MVKRVALVSCVKHKRDEASPARDLYLSPLFRGLRQYAESYSDAWFILSAEHGVVAPDQVVTPYDRTLKTMGRKERLSWAQRVQRQLVELIAPGTQVIILAGNRYRQDLVPFLQARGCVVTVPFAGLKIGEQLHRLKAMFT